jgi:amino acid transporter
LIHEEIIGAIIFILGFSLGALYYYFNLFKTEDLHRTEYILSIIFVFFLTITMFAVIYAEPIENSNNYFMEFGKPYNITFPDAFYFSTTTITTLGYGDITPVGVFRLFVIIEVLMGLIYTGSMIYFIVKIFEKK